jgi:2-oxoisovalerate dehydrogenase E1 component
MTTEVAATRAPLDREHAVHLLKEMLRIRRFEEKCAEMYSAGRIRGFLHLYIGEEAVAVGAMQALTPEDAVVATYREHGHALARGIPVTALMAEMYGKREGCSHGRGGSMHVFDAATRFFGGNAIVAGGLPIAVGLALADQMQGRRRVTACFFGDGAVAEGEFHESLNLAALWKLPVLFLCENNLYAMGTRIDRALAQTDICLKAQGYGLAAETVDGMDVLAVEEQTLRVADGVRRGDGPSLLELRTYRFRAHSMFDPELYRDKERDRVVETTRSDSAPEGQARARRRARRGDRHCPRDRRDRGNRRRRSVCRGWKLGAARRSHQGRVHAMTHLTYRDALRAALREALGRDTRVFLMGEDVGRYGGAYAVSKGLLDEFGPERIRDTPLSESTFVGTGIGAALGGMRPIVEVMTVNFGLLALDQIVNNAATIRHMSGGQFSIPLVIRMATGAGRQLAAQHAHSLEGWLAHIRYEPSPHLADG